MPKVSPTLTPSAIQSKLCLSCALGACDHIVRLSCVWLSFVQYSLCGIYPCYNLFIFIAVFYCMNTTVYWFYDWWAFQCLVLTLTNTNALNNLGHVFLISLSCLQLGGILLGTSLWELAFVALHSTPWGRNVEKWFFFLLLGQCLALRRCWKVLVEWMNEQILPASVLPGGGLDI